MHQKECTNKILLQAVSVMRALVFFVLLLVSMVSVLNTARAASASPKEVRGHVHFSHPYSNPYLRKAASDDVTVIPGPYDGAVQDITNDGTAQDTTNDGTAQGITTQTINIANGQQEDVDQGQQDQNKPDGTDGSDTVKVITVDGNTEVVADKESSVVVIDNGDNCDNDHHKDNDHQKNQQEDHNNKHHRHHHHNNNNKHHHNNNNIHGSSFFAAGGSGPAIGRGPGGYPSMPFTGSDPRPLASK